MAFERKFLSNASATGTNGNVFVYCNVDKNGNAADDTAAMTADGFFDAAKDVLRKGNTIIVNDGATPNILAVTSLAGVTPITTAALPII